MRLIDADALQAIYKRNSITEKIMVLDKSPMQHLIDAPTVDAVEVVRCKDCGKQPVCRFGQYLGNYGFCSNGVETE